MLGHPRDPQPRTNSTTSFLSRVTRRATAPAKQGKLTQQTVSSYHLQWKKLEAFLIERYPKEEYPEYVLDFKERKV